jgi:phenylalanyl-tRNA synthetase beta chain
MSLFEIGDVVLKDPKTEIGVRNERRLCAVYTDSKGSGFEVILIKLILINNFFKKI